VSFWGTTTPFLTIPGITLRSVAIMRISVYILTGSFLEGFNQ
jgi:hypothetical protein